MPINELEQHLYLNYYQEFENQISGDYYQGIIIGSFPIYAVTDSIDLLENQIAERFMNEASMRFFYGSKKSDLWKYVGFALNPFDPRKDENDDFLNHEVAKENCKNLLFDHKLLMSDSLYRTNRRLQSASDKDLMVESYLDDLNALKSYNYNLITQLKANIGIQSIYFTSTETTPKSPFGWFKEIFQNHIEVNQNIIIGNRQWSAIGYINFGDGDVRKYNLFFLPTPKPRGIHWNEQRTLIFENYVGAIFPEFYAEINLIPVAQYNPIQKARLSELRNIFLIESYRQAIIFNNLNFDGTNPIN